MAIPGVSRKRDASGRYDCRPSSDMLVRFESNISPEPMSGCWLWTGALHCAFGYGAFKIGPRKSKVETSHRLSYQIYKGEIPKGMLVRHDCDNPACVNPSHLRIGTARDNACDKVERGRHVYGENVWNAKATIDLVIKMRSMPRSDAIAYGISHGIARQTANDIVSNRTWKQVQSAIVLAHGDF